MDAQLRLPALASLAISLLACTGDPLPGMTDGSEDSETDETCPTPLPPEAFEPDNQLMFKWGFGPIELPAGLAFALELGLLEAGPHWEALETCSVYSVEPDDLGATIDPDTGLLSLVGVADGTELTVRADIEDGLASVEARVLVYDPALHPLAGQWQEIARIPCGGGPEYAPDEPMEISFQAFGTMRVAWIPFDVHVDYWGDYVAADDDGSLSLSNLMGNFLPDDVDGEGSFAFEGEELVLSDMWLGLPEGSMDSPACGHRFAQ